MNPSIVAHDITFEWTSPGGGHTDTAYALTVEYDADTMRPSLREVERLAEQYLADRNGYVGRISCVYYDGSPVTVYGSARAAYRLTVTTEN